MNRRRAWLYTAAVALVICAACVSPGNSQQMPGNAAGTGLPRASTQSPTDTRPANPDSRTLFAVKFENATGSEEYDPAADGLADVVAVMLARQPGVNVVERYKLAALTTEQAISLKGLTQEKYALEAGRLLHAETVLTGRLFLVQGHLMAHARVLEVASQRVLAAEQYGLRPQSLLEGSLQIARSLAGQMALPLPQLDPAEIDASPLANLHLAEALGCYYAGDLEEALMQFMRTIDLDADLVESHYWQGVCYHKLGEYDHAVVELSRYLNEKSACNYLPQARQLLAEARQKAESSAVPHLGPAAGPAVATMPSSTAATRPVAAGDEAGRPRPKNVAVFNFHMKAGDNTWVWLEKALADQVATDFSRDRSLAVVARDEMQAIARRIDWCPELESLDPGKLQKIKDAIAVKHIVTGVYTVENGRLRIIAQVVAMDTRLEVARTSVEGPVDDALQIQKRLSSELLSWFTQRPAQQILPELPLWTRSIPASRSVYEGMDLYDQGRYDEAWLRFRRASREDPCYMESRYWVGKMYYFMDRYEHARLSMERLVHLNLEHPRLGDALKEYVHTYEKTGTEGRELLGLYERIKQRYPQAQVYGETDYPAGVAAKRWLEVRAGQLLGQMGQFREGVLAAAGDHALWGPRGSRVAFINAMNHHLLTGETLLPSGLLESLNYEHVCRFAEDSNELTVNEPGQAQHVWHWLVAPKGYIFKSLAFYPIVRGENRCIGVIVHKDHYGDSGSGGLVPIRVAAEKGLHCAKLPRTGILRFHYWHDPREGFTEDKWSIDKMRIVAEFEKIPDLHGAIEVSCSNTEAFSVLVDGRTGRTGAGLIGLLPPGPHELEFVPTQTPSASTSVAECSLQRFRTTVDVKEGQAVSVQATLPWKEGSAWSRWLVMPFADMRYPGYDLCLRRQWSRPSIQMDNDAIRIVWSRMGDLWYSASTDGRTFSAPSRLPIPVSSAWTQERPVCIRDESGRFLLAFSSDRNGQHEDRLYVCWSRDFVHWTAPAMVLDRGVSWYDIMQDDKGRFICAEANDQTAAVLASRDAYRWEKLAQIPLPGKSTGLHLIQGPDGVFRLVAACTGQRPNAASNIHVPPTCDHVVMATSNDGVDWSGAKEIAVLATSGCLSFSIACPQERMVAACFGNINRRPPTQLEFLAQNADGRWIRSKGHGFLGYDGAMGWHRKWGYVLAWSEPPASQFYSQPSGPFVIRGPSLDRALADQRGASRPSSSQPATSDK